MPKNRDIISVASAGGQLTTITRDKLPTLTEMVADHLADCDDRGWPKTPMVDKSKWKDEGDGCWSTTDLVESEACSRALVPAGGHEAIDPEARRALDRLKFRVRLAGLYGLTDEEMGARIVTIVRSGAHRQVVLCELADAAKQANENYDWTENYDHFAGVWAETVKPTVYDEKLEKNVLAKDPPPFRPVFDADDYGCMANHAHDFIIRQLRVSTLTAVGEKQFLTDRGPLRLDIVDPLIRKALNLCDLRDDGDPLAPAIPNSRTFAEVRRAMAAKWPQVGVVAVPESEAAVAVEGNRVTVMIADGGPRSFASDKLELREDYWIDIDALWGSWFEWCAEQGREPGDRSNAMGKLSRALGLKRGKRRSGGSEPRAGYWGAKLRG